MRTTTAPVYVGSSEAAAICRVHRDTMRRWADKGLVPVHRTASGARKFLLSDLQALMDGQISVAS